MELPASLKSAVERLLENQPLEPLMKAAERLSSRYRREVRDGVLHIGDDLAAKAYLAARLPATFAAVRAALEAVAESRSDFAPKTLLDVGSGPGTALWATSDCWDGLERATLVEASPAIRKVGETLSAALPFACDWQAGDITRNLPALPPADLVTLAYVLDELPVDAVAKVTTRLWAMTGDVIAIIEPGTPAGFQRILVARQTLIDQGAHILAPCTHNAACPVHGSDWCHFSRRVARSRLHRQVKQGEVPWEDEKYIFIAAARKPATIKGARVLMPPRIAGGVARLKLCESDGQLAEVMLSRRDGEAFKAARRADWGDLLATDIINR
ncbi:small ribosomal subunit Rsm22 family protein [Rhizobium paknamense]|uniref:Ribosomal protein RSM22 (Predicted rRNA methylase) n=1 Tax=Rhizobium paknamense TaxID=1206817 RepID=A0ABU0IA53_9HYPH|nr:small ribosomal subunit Rsm22 family protein [Rhizobium paknamense]MDQ0454104.1 ribosomal protein RSM22 (predicted rRNA methylase) [Rhizobium paknamense]